MEKNVHQALKADGLVVIGITIGSADDAKAFAKEHGVTYPILIDPDFEFCQAFGVNAIPFNAVVGADGKVAFAALGGDVDKVKAEAEAALAAAKKNKKAADATPERKKKPER